MSLTLSDWVVIIGLFSTIITILLGVKKIGNVEQSFKDGISRLDEKVEDGKATVDKAIDRFDSHCNDKTFHRNVELEQRVALDLDKFQTEVKSKLDKLLLK